MIEPLDSSEPTQDDKIRELWDAYKRAGSEGIKEVLKKRNDEHGKESVQKDEIARRSFDD